jgi:hypothetical protein
MNELLLIGRVPEAVVKVVDEVTLGVCGDTDRTLELAAGSKAAGQIRLQPCPSKNTPTIRPQRAVSPHS